MGDAEHDPRNEHLAGSHALGEEYLRKRNQILELKYQREAMNLALERDQLVSGNWLAGNSPI